MSLSLKSWCARLHQRGLKLSCFRSCLKPSIFVRSKKPIFSIWRPRSKITRLFGTFSILPASSKWSFRSVFLRKKNQVFYNTVAVIDADGSILGIYRKTHIPDGPGYEEKFYFNPGDTGFRVWKTRYAAIGIGVCWDQWFPEAARSMVLMGAEILFFPTAIGSEPPNPDYDSKDHWQLCMRGHAAANMVPVVASNRIGIETIDQSTITFYGSSFITDNTGRLIAEADRESESVILAEFNLSRLEAARRGWGLFRDRRPNTYDRLTTCDGQNFPS